MAEKVINTIMQLRYDTYENWVEKNPVLRKGEVAFATLESNKGGVQNAPTVIIKVGDGTSDYKTLKIVSGLAADVYSWAKGENKPTYTAGEITGLADYIAGEIEDTDTQYQIVVDSTNVDSTKVVYSFQSKTKGGSWNDVTSFSVPSDDGIKNLINSAITALDLTNAYDTKGSAKTVQDNLDAYKTSNDKAVADVKSTADAAKSTIDAFMKEAVKDGDTEQVIDTLKEIQEFIASDKTATAELVAKSHEHANKTVLDGITSDKVTAWDTSEQNAKEYADSLAGNYATAEQGKKADTALQSISTTKDGGLKVTGTNQIDIDDSVTFVFNCGDASGNPL